MQRVIRWEWVGVSRREAAECGGSAYHSCRKISPLSFSMVLIELNCSRCFCSTPDYEQDHKEHNWLAQTVMADSSCFLQPNRVQLLNALL